MINVVVGIISRSATWLNLFSFGFPITLISVFSSFYMYQLEPLVPARRV